MWLKENRENRITCFGGCSSFRGSISLRDFSSCGPNLRAQIGWGRNLVRELPAHYLENHRAHHSIFTTIGAIGVSETSFPDIEGQLPISPDIAGVFVLPVLSVRSSTVATGCPSPMWNRTPSPTFALRGHFPGSPRRKSIVYIVNFQKTPG